MDAAKDFLLLRLAQSHSGGGGVLSSSMSSARLWVPSGELSPRAIPLQAKKLLVKTKRRGLFPSWIWLTYLLSASLPDVLGAAASTTCWAQGSGDVPRGGGQPEEVSQLLFKQSLLKLVTVGCISCCLCGFAVHRVGGVHGAGRISTTLCVALSLQKIPCMVCIQINAHTCF